VLAFFIAILLSAVYRSRIARRRVQRQLERAIAAGIILPEQLDAVLKGDLPWKHEQPKIWDVQLDKGGALAKDLKDVRPLSACILLGDWAPPPPPPPRTSSAFRDRLTKFFTGSRAPHPRDAHTQLPVLQSPNQLQVTVFVSLPRPPQQSEDADILKEKGKGKNNVEDTRENELENLLIGVTELPWKGTALSKERS